MYAGIIWKEQNHLVEQRGQMGRGWRGEGGEVYEVGMETGVRWREEIYEVGRGVGVMWKGEVYEVEREWGMRCKYAQGTLYTYRKWPYVAQSNKIRNKKYWKQWTVFEWTVNKN